MAKRTCTSWPPDLQRVHYDLANGVIQVNTSRAIRTADHVEVFKKLAEYLPSALEFENGMCLTANLSAIAKAVKEMDFDTLKKSGIMVISLTLPKKSRKSGYNSGGFIQAHFDYPNFGAPPGVSYSDVYSANGMLGLLNDILKDTEEELKEHGRIELADVDEQMPLDDDYYEEQDCEQGDEQGDEQEGEQGDGQTSQQDVQSDAPQPSKETCTE